MARIFLSFSYTAETLWFVARYYGAWAFFFPEFALKLLYYLPAVILGLAPGAFGGYLDLSWRRYQYVWMHHAAGLMLADPGQRDDMAEARRWCRARILEIDETFDLLYE